MPLERYDGTTINDLAAAIGTIENQRGTVVQVVGQYDGAWWVITKAPSRTQRETRTVES